MTQLIARRVREAGVYSEILPFNNAADGAFERLKPKAVILSGGPACVTEYGSPARARLRFSPPACRCSASATASRRMAAQLGGKVEGGHAASSAAPTSRSARRARCSTASGEVGERYPVWMSHGDRVTQLPPGFTVMAT